MQDAELSASEELSLLVRSLRAQLLWQQDCGAYALPTESIRSQLTESIDSVETRFDEPARALVPERIGPSTAQPAAPVAAPEPAPVRFQAAVSSPIPVFDVPASADGRRARLAEIAAQCASCSKCALHQARKQAVFSRGNPETEIMIVGEGPGAEEDAQRVPFVGAAGQLLDKMIGAMGYGPDDFYICNVVKCRPPKNRTPEPEEMAACMPYLHEQIALISPKIIISMGSTALKGLLGVQDGITRARGKWRLYRASIPVMPTFHPAYLLRQESAKRDVWADLKEVLKHMGRTVPEKKR
jgi:DNA polymerase